MYKQLINNSFKNRKITFTDKAIVYFIYIKNITF